MVWFKFVVKLLENGHQGMRLELAYSMHSGALLVTSHTEGMRLELAYTGFTPGTYAGGI